MKQLQVEVEVAEEEVEEVDNQWKHGNRHNQKKDNRCEHKMRLDEFRWKLKKRKNETYIIIVEFRRRKHGNRPAPATAPKWDERIAR